MEKIYNDQESVFLIRETMNEFLDTEIGKTFYPVHKIGQYFLIKK